MTTENRIQENVEIKAEAMLKLISPQTDRSTKESRLEALGWGNEDQYQSHSKTSLARSKSMSSLQSPVVSVQALKVHLESKEDTQKKVKNNLSSSRSAETTQVVTEEAEKVKKNKKSCNSLSSMFSQL